MQERAWINQYIRPLVSASGAAALRDDVALLSPSSKTIITMDTLVAGVHFLDTDPLDTVGQKLVRVNVSDIHAKGACPKEALLSIAWPGALSQNDFAALMTGIGADLAQFGVALIGGDFVRTPGPLTLTLTVTGQCLNTHPVRRGGGHVGDGVFVDGEIGWGALGLSAAQRGQNDAVAQRYRVPQISRIEAAQLVAEFGHAAMDISDGLLRDGLSLAQASGCGISLALDQVPLAKGPAALDDILKLSSAGDDYRILMTAPTHFASASFSRIGTLIDAPGLHLTYQGRAIPCPDSLGFEHSTTTSTEPDLS